MKSLTLVSTGSLCLAMFACSTAAQAPPSAMGGTSSGGSGATAGTGTVGTAGTAGTGNSSSGGTMASAGTSSGGGVTSGGSSSGGSAGSETSGGSGGAPAGGMSGGGGASGSGTVDTTLVGAWDGALLEYACGSQGTTNYDCPQPSADNCKNATAADGASVIPPTNNVPSSWTMGGTPGTMYNVTMHVQGVVEVSWYHGGTRAAGNDTSVTVTPRNLFQVGGTALTFADTGNGFDYNQYELDVTAPGGGTPTVYFLNSVKPSENPHTSSTTQHLTFDVDYTATIQVPGGGKVSLTVRDSNCVEVQNCGTSSQSSCMGPRSISLAGDMPAPPASWNGKVTSSGMGGAVENGQFIHFDITSVTVAQ